VRRVTIVLDALMPATAVLQRFARHGLWRDPAQPDAQAVIADVAARTGRDIAVVAERLARDADRFGVAIWRTIATNVLWYGHRAEAVLDRCLAVSSGTRLIDVMNLNEYDSEIPNPAVRALPPGHGGLVVDGSEVVFDDSVERGPAVAEPSLGSVDLATATFVHRGLRDAPAVAPEPLLHAWPLLDAPATVEATKPIYVTVGLLSQAEGASDAALRIPLAPGATAIDLVVDLFADGFDAAGGVWHKPLRAEVGKLDKARVTFQLVGRDPAGDEGVLLTTVSARFLHQGVVLGSVSRAIVVYRVGTVAPALDARGRTWISQPPVSAPLSPLDTAHAADLTIEIVHPAANPSQGRYLCRLCTPLDVTIDPGPHPIELGEDAKTFARQIVEQVREFAGDELTENLFESLGNLVAEKLPRAVFDAVAAVASKVAPQVPAVLLVSAEPYVPWELATLSPVLDATRPPFLGAQVLLGRWWREAVAGGLYGPSGRVARPPVDPPARIAVGAMAVMAAQYKEAESGLRRLPQAEAEAKELATTHDAVLMTASTNSLKKLLDAKVEVGLDVIGAIDAVHFAGHGEFDPSIPDGSMMYLVDGKPLSSMLFRSAKYGDAHQPLAFFNACMIGIGGELLGDAGGFPGNCLRGGFGGMAGALWEVDDVQAREVALEFWRRALPDQHGSCDGEPVAAIWRDLRTRFAPQGTMLPQATYLSYVFYGHPRLALQRRA
jgi:hypothetical protein